MYKQHRKTLNIIFSFAWRRVLHADDIAYTLCVNLHAPTDAYNFESNSHQSHLKCRQLFINHFYIQL